MKRFFAFVLAAVMIFSMVTGCSFNNEKTIRGDVIEEYNGEFVITKMDVVAYTNTSMASMKRDYIVALENDSVGFVVNADADMYIPCNIGDVISGRFVVTDSNNAYFECKLEHSDTKSTYMVSDYVIFN